MFGKNSVGVFLGPQGLSIVETTSIGKVKNSIYSPYPKDISRPSGTTIPRDNIFNVFLDNEVEIVAFMQKALRESRVNLEGNVVICVPNRDLIVRFFEIPPIPRKDLNASISFEIKKYIPFKIEEIIYDYQTFPQKNLIEVLFAGMKNEDIQKYNSILTQLKVGVLAIEPSQFSLLRLLKAKKVILGKEAVVVAELEKGEGTISIIDNGIPCFSRDIKIATTEEAAQPADAEAVSFRIVNEIRVSMDYFRRQFLKKGVDKIIILSKDDSKELVATLNKELGIPVQLKNPDDILGAKEENSLSLAKAAGASLRANNSFSLLINLAKKKKTGAVTLLSPKDMLSDTLNDILDIPKPLMIKTFSFALVALLGVFMWGSYRLKPLNDDIRIKSKEANSILTADLENLDNGTLEVIRNKHKDSLTAFKNAFVKDFLIGVRLEVLPELMPKGVWLEELIFDRSGRYIYLKGVAYNENEDKAQQSPYTFISNLKNSPTFINKIGNISVKSIRSAIENGYKVTRFEIDISLKI